MNTEATSPIIAAAMIGGALSLLGLLVKSIYDSFEKRQLYKELRNDMQKAIYAEISAFVDLQKRNQLEAFGERVVVNILNEDAYFPFLVREKHDAVFQAMLPQIHYLPLETIDIVTRYYQRISFVMDMKDAMMSDVFRELTAKRRALIYRDYIATLRYAFDEGKEALQMIERYSKGGANAVLEYKSAQSHARSEQNKIEVKAWLDTHKNQ